MTEKTTTQKIAELKSLASDARSNMYRRVKLAAEIIKDVDWLEQAFMGKTLTAMDFLAREGFPYVLLTVGQLSAIYAKWPEENQWKEFHYDVNLMWDELKSTQKPERKTAHVVSWKEKAEQLQAELRIKELENVKLERKVAELEGELRGRKEAIVPVLAPL